MSLAIRPLEAGDFSASQGRFLSLTQPRTIRGKRAAKVSQYATTPEAETRCGMASSNGGAKTAIHSETVLRIRYELGLPRVHPTAPPIHRPDDQNPIVGYPEKINKTLKRKSADSSTRRVGKKGLRSAGHTLSSNPGTGTRVAFSIPLSTPATEKSVTGTSGGVVRASRLFDGLIVARPMAVSACLL
jgi:hypothetical protein